MSCSLPTRLLRRRMFVSGLLRTFPFHARNLRAYQELRTDQNLRVTRIGNIQTSRVTWPH
jgi:hypothetical protein